MAGVRVRVCWTGEEAGWTWAMGYTGIITSYLWHYFLNLYYGY